VFESPGSDDLYSWNDSGPTDVDPVTLYGFSRNLWAEFSSYSVVEGTGLLT
jgi:hypothetical protein